MICPGCGTENEPGRRFCGECGSKLALVCASCGAANTPGTKFCGDCGTALAGGAPTPAPAPPPEAERRLVSVLFADLVGFTTLSEDRDPEEVRELLSQYFDAARQIIGRYGGTVEKFIGDAVMALWGAPIAREDDAERAVRAGLDLVDAVSALIPGLEMRVGVASGESAVTLGAEGQGMVAGDLVNTASRIQSVAKPGTVVAGESTKRMSEAAIDYEDTGRHELKGKAEAIQLWRAVRVVGTRGGEGRSTSLEAPFVGRAGELRLVKELFHTTTDESKARLVSVVGVAGIGKSRLAWEFEKYVDGLIDDIWWHRGRCLAYGEGVAYWALAEMVRWRSGILEDEAPESAQAKLRSTVERFVPDAEERAWIEPRLRHLLGLTERIAPDQQDLFSAWRRLFELMAGLGTGRPPVRGSPLGGRRPARFHRVPARVVAEPPHLRPHARQAGAARAPTLLGRRAAQLQLPLPRAACRRCAGGALARPGARTTRGCPSPDRRAGGGRTALRHRDRPDAPRPRHADA